jgi:hypothetical protein
MIFPVTGYLSSLNYVVRLSLLGACYEIQSYGGVMQTSITQTDSFQSSTLVQLNYPIFLGSRMGLAAGKPLLVLVSLIP